MRSECIKHGTLQHVCAASPFSLGRMTGTESARRVVIIGGGISGLATAHRLRGSLGGSARVVLVEGSPKLGGKIATRRLGRHLIDSGPDALLTRSPAVGVLIDELGLAGRTMAPAALGARIWSRGRLRPLPSGTMFGIPDRVLPLVASRLLSPAGLARAALDLVLPRRRRFPADPSVADLIGSRLGAQVSARLVEPLIGGVHAGLASELSARSTVPDIEALARGSRSLYLGLRRLRRKASSSSAKAPGGPALVTLEGGLVELVEALAAGFSDEDLIVGDPAVHIARRASGYVVTTTTGLRLEAEAVVLAVPAYTAARLLAGLEPSLAELLAETTYADVATIALSYPRSALIGPLDATGFLVPPEEGRLLVGCTWSSAKWPHLADDRSMIVRCAVGRHGDRRWMALDDDELIRRVHDELVEAMWLTGEPTDGIVQRWPRGLPQYLVGHEDRMASIDERLRTAPDLHLVGAAYRGVGLASCVADAERVAERVTQRLLARPMSD